MNMAHTDQSTELPFTPVAEQQIVDPPPSAASPGTGISEDDVEIAFDQLEAIAVPRQVFDPEILRELAQLLPYQLAVEYDAILLERQRDGSFFVGMASPKNFVAIRAIARQLKVATSALHPRVLNPARLAVLLGEAYVQTVSGTHEQTAAAHEDDLSDPDAKQASIEWSSFDANDSARTGRDVGEPEIEIGQGTGLRAAAERIILAAIARRASDIHIVPQNKYGYVKFRTDGTMYTFIPSIPPDRMENLLNAFCDMAGVNGYEVSQRGMANEITVNLKTQSGRKERRTLRFQGRPSLHGRVIVIRINHSVFRDFDQIGLEANQALQIDNALANRSGLVLVTGPTGSGKSNTLEAMLRKLEQMHEGRANIIQIGNPIEFWNDDREQLTLKTEEDWVQAFHQCLRMDPDILSPGEFRSAAEAGVVFQAAATGHLTLTTLHTNNVAQTFSRLDFLGIERDKQAALLKLLVSQELVPLLCPHCKAPDPRGLTIANQLIEVVFPNRHDLKDSITGADSLPFFHKVGCSRCENKGTKYRTCIAEALTITPEISRMLRNNVDGEDIVNHAVRRSDMITLAEAAARKLCRGLISYDSVKHLLQYPHTVAPEAQTYSWTQKQPANAPYDADAVIIEETPDDFVEADFVDHPTHAQAA